MGIVVDIDHEYSLVRILARVGVPQGVEQPIKSVFVRVAARKLKGTPSIFMVDAESNFLAIEIDVALIALTASRVAFICFETRCCSYVQPPGDGCTIDREGVAASDGD